MDRLAIVVPCYNEDVVLESTNESLLKVINKLVEDGLIDFFFRHVIKFNESWKYPIHFVGGIAFHFKDVVKDLCNNYGLQLGTINKRPMDGLIKLYQ